MNKHKIQVSYVYLCPVRVSCSLCSRLRESASDLPIPLVPVDSETERHIWEKDEEVCPAITTMFSVNGVGSSCRRIKMHTQ